MATTQWQAPSPPGELWGLWLPTDGVWLNHIHKAWESYSAPMTFVDRRDAEEAAIRERDNLGVEVIAARIGVAPPDA